MGATPVTDCAVPGAQNDAIVSGDTRSDKPANLSLSNSLDALAAQINAEHEGVCASLRQSLQGAFKCGDLLIKAKRIAGHGNFEDWVHAHCDFGIRTAQFYMRVARNRAEIEAKAKPDSFLTMDDALNLLTASRIEGAALSSDGTVNISLDPEPLPSSTVPRIPGVKRRDQIAAVIVAYPKNSDSQIAGDFGVPPYKVEEVRSEIEDREKQAKEVQVNLEDPIIDLDMVEVKRTIERIVQHAIGCNRAVQVIGDLRKHLDNMERIAAKQSRPRTN
jgi:hypothetical protein